MQKKLLSRKEAATYSGLTLYLVDRLIKAGEIGVVRPFGRVMVHREMLDDWINTQAATFQDGRAGGDDD